ncbi:glycogen debranching N-terminal domain-containing protein [Pseudolysinimonas kribbensis]|uniref:MGH1-like glycoside hydrolase domain-containing protein n=1 Tax=Pseudolysinimonas kribbensis TaxID=433641 RepID=UPI0031CFACC4
MSSAPHAHGLQPLLHEAVVALHAPVQVWSGADGGIGAEPVHGVYVGDIRVLRGLRLTVGGAVGEHLLTTSIDAGTVEFTTLFRGLDGPGADPDVRGTLTRRVTADGVEHRFELSSRLPHDLAVELVVELEPDLTPMSAVKEGVIPGAGISPTRTDEGIEWSGGGVRARITGAGWDATLSDSFTPPVIAMRGRLRVPAHGAGSAGLALRVRDEHAVVRAAGPATIARPASRPADDRLARWLDRALGDLDALRLETSDLPGEAFLAAGAPWFLTLFGRDAIWAARMLLPLDTRMAGGTLRVLAALQGTRDDPGLAEQPGKILHELRRDELALPSQGIRLPPRYYGTIDATPLWVSLLADARRAGLPDGEVRALTPNLRAALHWMRDAGDSDGDGLLEYVDTSGRGLANQGWKDSGDSVQWRDGRLAEGPIALCEVQAYAHRAALDGAELLDAFGDHGEGDAWRAWAEALAQRFRTAFWIDDPAGAYPAIALDAHKRPVDTVTSNIGHLLGTGLLNRDEAALVAQRLVSPELASGYGLRTLSTDAAGYWPLSYHGGSVWTHDTAIAITGLAAEGFGDEAADLAEGLLRAAVAFEYRMPELYGGDPATTTPAPTPYPAACRPQAWSAAAAVAVWAALERVE